MLTTLAVIAATVVGTMVGVEFAVAVFVNPIFLRMPAGAAIEARADGGRVLGRVMPFWYIASLILTTGLAVAVRGAPATSAAAVGAGLLAVSVIMSITLLVPINSRSATWTADHHPADWREQTQRWDRLHYARVAIIIAGFVLTLVAATLA
ncbi:MAG: anthrone oxygenase family protein [Streptosporangiaceae bacterium]